MYSNKNKLIKLINKKKFKKIFILSGKKSFINSCSKHLFKNIIKKKIVKIYFKSSPYPEFEELKKINKSLMDFSPDLFIAIGGGSVLDYGKIANVFLYKNIKKQKIISGKNTFKKNYKLIAIPTTAGSGAEVTSNAVIYVNKKKYSIENQKIMPDYYFLIPELLIKVPKKVKASSGFDAIAQAIESMISKRSNSISFKFAKKSLKISLKNFINYIERPNLKNTKDMCLAANFCGKAINISKTTAPHAVSYPFTSMYKLSHGHAVSLNFEKFLKFNFINMSRAKCKFNLKNRYKSIFKLIGVRDILEFENYIKKVKKKAGLETNLKLLNINLKENINKIVSGINIKRLNNNPVNLTKQDVKRILLKP